MPDFPDLMTAAQNVPPGSWAIGVSGGADSVALFCLLQQYRPDLELHVVHLDHQTRGNESTADAAFIADLAHRLHTPLVTAKRLDLETTLKPLPANSSARYREVRLALFKQAVDHYRLNGVILAHHADDVAETVFHRLLRGSGISGLAGIGERTEIGGLVLLRPLLDVRRNRLREFLIDLGQPWREDASNESTAYLRNRLRVVLSNQPKLSEDLRLVGSTCRALRDWVQANAVTPAETPSQRAFDGPTILAKEASRRWLSARSVPENELTPAVIQRLLDMANDAATPSKQQFPGNVTVRRRKGILSASRE